MSGVAHAEDRQRPPRWQPEARAILSIAEATGSTASSFHHQVSDVGRARKVVLMLEQPKLRALRHGAGMGR
jgi:hypothetical protein